MRWLAHAAWAAALLTCAMPTAWADTDTHWLIDPYTRCALFDANAKPGDTVGWSGDCESGFATGQGTAIFMHGEKQLESFTGNFAKGAALDGPVDVNWGEGWRYEGDQASGQFSGPGVLVNNAKDRFDGNWVAGKMNGQGTLVRANGERYVGAWRDDLPNGPGTLTRADGSVVKGVFRDGKLEGAILDRLETVKADTVKKDLPDVHAFASISGKTLQSVDGSRIALTLIEGGIERQITDTGAASKKTTFTFMNDRLGTVVEDGGAAAGANVTGFFRLTDTGVEVRYADGRGELLTATPDGGVLMQRSAVSGETSCRSWYPDGHAFSEADKKQALAEYASHLGLAPTPKASCDAAPGPQAMLRPSSAKGKEPAAQAKLVSLRSPVRVTAPGTITALLPVTVRESVIHSIDTGAPPVVMTQLPLPQASIAAGQRDASACLKVESDGSHWSFRNACGYSVQFSYCMLHGAESLAACDGANSRGISGSVAANSVAMLTTDTSFREKDGDHDFRWIACDGGAGEVVAHLDHVDPPSGRCERAAVAANQH
jgi:hypothetical protein